MPLKLTELKNGTVLEVDASGKLTDEDYQQQFIPEVERLTKEHRKIRLLFEMNQFHGWEPKAAWDDLKLGSRHRDNIERVAMVGEKHWQHWMASFAKPFTAAQIRYFDKTQAGEARVWVEEGITAFSQ
ncbi:MAG TPA: STAS/SEC14 domain-containing protein [Candidatus Angelobacter sp.]|nr:STAS/SEC14 domain-containing protein [Candidatus Angelobacter sp.]